MTYPNQQQVEEAGEGQLALWERDLPSPRNKHELDIVNLISYRLRYLSGVLSGGAALQPLRPVEALKHKPFAGLEERACEK